MLVFIVTNEGNAPMDLGWLGSHLVDMLGEEHTFEYGPRLIRRHHQKWQYDVVIHLAWRKAVVGNRHPAEQIESLMATRNLIEQVKDTNTRLIFASTQSVYGHERTPITCAGNELMTPTPNCLYSMAKLFAETDIRTHIPNSKIIRFGSFMGKGILRTPTSGRIVNAFVWDAVTKGRIEVWNKDAWKPLIHVRDAAATIIRAMETPEWPSVINAHSYNKKAINIAWQVRNAFNGPTEEQPEVAEIESPNPLRSTNTNNILFLERMRDHSFISLEQSIAELRAHFRATADNMGS